MAIDGWLDATPWEKELLHIRRNRLDGRDVRQTPLLNAKVEELADGKPDYDEHKLLKDVLELLPVEHQEAARFLFGLKNGVAYTDNKGVFHPATSPTARRRSAANAVRVDYDSFRRSSDGLERRIIQRVVAQIQRLSPAGLVPDPYPTRYLARQGTDEALDLAEALAKSSQAGWQRERLIVVKAESGCGASRSVYEHFRARGPVVLNARDDLSLTLGACALVERAGYPVPCGDGAALYALGRHLSSDRTSGPNPPAVLILDKVPDVERVLKWLPQALASLVVVVTSGAVQRHVAPLVSVGPLRGKELASFVADACDLADLALITRIGRLAEGRATSILAIADLLVALEVSDREAIATVLDSDLIAVLEVGTAGSREGIAQIHVQEIRKIRSSRPDSLLLLSTLVFGLSRHQSPEALAALTTEGGLEESSTPAGRLAFSRALRPLLVAGLVRTDSTQIWVDPLAARLGRIELADTFSAMLDTVISNAFDTGGHFRTAADLHANGWTLTEAVTFIATPVAVLGYSEAGTYADSFDSTILRENPDTEGDAARLADLIFTKAYVECLRLETNDVEKMAPETDKAFQRFRLDREEFVRCSRAFIHGRTDWYLLAGTPTPIGR